MQSLIFLSRVAFICNICFALTWLMRYLPSLETGHVAATILVLGLVVAFILNGVLMVFLLIAMIGHSHVFRNFPQWLLITNFLFFILQLILFTA